MDDSIPIGHGVGDEPHFGQGAVRPDPSEELASEVLDDERARGDPDGHLAEQSVHEEAHTLYARATRVRGERANAGWAAWFERKRTELTWSESWCAVLVCALASGPLAVIGTLLAQGDFPLAVVVFAPAIEEVLKVGLLAILVETRPYLLRSASQIRLVAYVSALVFAVVENLLYLHVYIDDPTPTLVFWRWSVCVGLHVGASAIAAEGLVFAWRRCLAEQMRPRLEGSYGWLGAAIAVHGLYNLAAILIEGSGFAF